MKHLDLFSGIGGFALACELAGLDMEHVFCEIDPFCQKVLQKNFPNSKIYGDIKALKADNLGRIDLLTGGFPCQPFSVAGKQRAQEDDRFLWPEMLRVIRETRPTWIIGENVAGIINLALEQVCLDLENEGYEVQPFIIPACAVNAPHRRDRVWIIAHARREHGETWGGKEFRGFTTKRTSQTGEIERHCETDHAPNTTSIGWDSGRDHRRERHILHDKDRDAKEDQSKWEGRNGGAFSPDDTFANTKGKRQLCERQQENDAAENRGEKRCGLGDENIWRRNWTQVAAELCGVDDGLPVELDGFKLTKAQHRAAQLKAYGNAIVPQVAAEIIKAIFKA